MRNRALAIAGVVAVCSLSRVGVAQQALPAEAEAALELLRASSSPGLEAVAREGRLVWVGGLAEPAAALAPEAAALEFLQVHGALAGVADARDLQVRSVSEVAGTTYVRYDATYLGRRILGAQVAVSVRDGAVRHVASGLRPFAGAVPGPVIDGRAATRAVVEASRRDAGAPVERAWLPLSGELVPVWLVPQREVAPARQWIYLVEATTGTVLWRQDQILAADGFVYDPNPVVSHGEVSRVELPRLTTGESLEGSRARAFQCVGETGDCSGWGGDCITCGLAEHYALPDEDGNFLYPPDEPNTADPFAEVHAYYHTDRVNQWFEEHLSYARRCGTSRVMSVYVNYTVAGDSYSSANAFYGDSDGDGCGDITLGEGLGVDFSYDADVIYHEFTHGIVESTGGLGCYPMGTCYDELGLDWTALGLNEGYADYFSVSLTGDPDLGEHAGTAGSGGEGSIRTAENDRLCPFDLVGESHTDGEIWVGTGWQLRELVGADIADRIMLRTLEALPQDADYAEAAAALLESCRAELDDRAIDEDQLGEIEALIGPEGRRITGCRRIVPLDQIPEGHAEDYMMLYTYRTMTFPAGLQWSVTAPRRATRLEYRVEDMYRSAERLVAHVRVGEPVGVEMSFNPGVGLSLTFTDDFSVELEGGVLELGPESDPPLQPDVTYYFALEYQCTRGCYLRARGEAEGAPNQLPVAAAGEDQEVTPPATVTLDGSGSYDPDGDELTFAWTVTGPEETTLDGAEGAAPSFAPTLPGDYVLSLTVADTEGGTATDSVTVHVLEADGGDGGPDGGDDDVDREGGCGCSAAASRPTAAAALLRSLLW